MSRDEIIEAGVRAYAIATRNGLIQSDSIVSAVLAAVEPLIRADERERNAPLNPGALRQALRAQIARDIEADSAALTDAHPDGFQVPDVLIGLSRAARIARGDTA